jgi:copper(I)-binding protein
MKKIYFTAFFALLVCLFSLLNTAKASNTISIKEGYIKASIPGSNITAAYMTLVNQSDKAITLQKITSDISDRIEIHEHSMVDDMMRMRQVEQITISAHSSIVLEPSGLHLMIFSLKQQLREDELKALTLHFSNSTKINIQLPVSRYK